ncbi:MAG: sodium-dependent transporter [Methanomicrobiaceae archaeon]|nr:sodium-dependent transporter [Methanomicrobiaceae archaeon]
MELWSSRFGFILAAIGSAVGIGNIWRFSAVLGQNGGGAYLIPYLIAVFLFAMPLMMLELSMGRHFRATVVSAFKNVQPRFNVIGWLLCATVFLILSYYLVITGWTLGYIVSSATGQMESFARFTGSYEPVLYFIITAAITGIVVSAGVQKGIEKISTVMIPFCVGILALMAVYVTTLPGFVEGITFFLSPDFSVLSNPLIWSAAFGQAFFSLSVGEGILITYGAYMNTETMIPHSAIIITIADLAVALMAGAVIFPIVFTFGLEPTIGAELAFSTLPKAFALMPGGYLLGIAFFLVLFFAGLTSAVSMLEVTVAAIREATGLSRRITAALFTGLVIIAGMPSALSYSAAGLMIGDVRILDFMDETVGELGLPVSAFLIAVIFTWFIPRTALEAQIGGGGMWLRLVWPLCRYLIPAVLILTTAARLLAGVDFPGWRFIPGTEFVGTLPQSAGAFIILAVLTLIILAICRLKGCGIPARLRGWL